MPLKISRRHFVRASALAFSCIASGCAWIKPRRANAAEEFVSVRGGQFHRRGAPYRFFGVNFWPAAWLGMAQLPGGQQRLRRELDHFQRLGVTNIRLLAGAETSPLKFDVQPAITDEAGAINEDVLRGLDFCLAEMARRDQHAVVMLSNYWHWSGGFATYVRRVTGEAIPDPDVPALSQGDWGAFMKFSARFYSLPEAQALYRGFITQLLERRNTITGVRYCDDPTIMTWEHANEPRPGTDDPSGEQNVPAFVKWLDETAQFIHARAPHQLVCTGSEGIIGCLSNKEHFIAAHRSPAIDYVTAHIWLKNWEWLKDPALGLDLDAATQRARDFVAEHDCIATDILRKPLVLEEFGLPRDHENLDPRSPTTALDEYFRSMAAQVAECARRGRSLQGANIWAWAGVGRPDGNAPRLTAASLVGDPPSEPQGLNSVYETDQTTLAVLAEANRQLKL